jgi:hypothetical protein
MQMPECVCTAEISVPLQKRRRVSAERSQTLPLKTEQPSQRHQQIGSTRDLARMPLLECRLRLLVREPPRLLGTPSSRPLTVPLARTNEDLTRHGDPPPVMTAAHRAAGKRRRRRDLVAAVAPMVARPCSPNSRAHQLRVADRTPRTPTPSRSSPAATRNRSSSRLTVFLMMVSLPLRLPGERRARARARTRGRSTQRSSDRRASEATNSLAAAAAVGG